MDSNSGECSGTNKECLPKLPSDVAAEVTRGQPLKHVETNEKNVLPTTLEGSEQKRMQEMLDVLLKSRAMKLRLIKDIGREKIDMELKEEIRAHDHAKLRHTDIVEKNVLPKPEDMYREKVDENLKVEIQTHDPSKLRHAEIVEKNVLPTPDDIAREKVPTLIESFDAEKLKHVEPVVKVTLPSADEMAREQAEIRGEAVEGEGIVAS